MNALPNKLILKQHQCPGDVLMLTAAVRDLKQTFPDIHIGVTTPYPWLWENNPYIEKLTEREAKIVPIGYKTPHQRKNNPEREHFIYAFHSSLEKLFDTHINRGAPFPDIHLTTVDRCPLIPSTKPLLLINAGSKSDFPIKQWPLEYFQKVADACGGRYIVIQIGETKTGIHSPLTGVVNMLNQTPGRKIVQLMAQAAAVITGVSFPMHLWAAVNYADNGNRHCAVLAGNREDVWWERYAGSHYLTAGCPDVLDDSGCWNRWLPPLITPKSEVCQHTVRLSNGKYYAACVAGIKPERVIECLL